MSFVSRRSITEMVLCDIAAVQDEVFSQLSTIVIGRCVWMVIAKEQMEHHYGLVTTTNVHACGLVTLQSVIIAGTGAKPTAGQMRTWLYTNDDNNGHLDKGKRRYNVLKWHIINESNRRVYLGIYISLSPFDASSWHSKPQLKMLLFVLNVLHDDQSQCIQWTFEPFELFHSHSDRTMYVSHAIHASQLHALHARTPERLQTVWIFMYTAFFYWSLVWIVRGEQEFVHVACMPHLTNTA